MNLNRVDNTKLNREMLKTDAVKRLNVNIGRNHVTAQGNVRCKFDMMIRWPADVVRFTSNPFTERGDRFADNKEDPRKMLRYLVRYFVAKHAKERWVRAELYDNTKPEHDVTRLILKYEKGEILVNLLITEYYQKMFAGIGFLLPAMLVPDEMK